MHCKKDNPKELIVTALSGFSFVILQKSVRFYSRRSRPFFENSLGGEFPLRRCLGIAPEKHIRQRPANNSGQPFSCDHPTGCGS